MSRVNFGAKPNMYPLPVLIIATYDKDGNPDAMNAAWGVVTDFNEISISMGDHKTTDNLAATGAFTVSMATEDTVVGCDYVGIESGRKVPDKFARAGFHATKSEFVNAPHRPERRTNVSGIGSGFVNDWKTATPRLRASLSRHPENSIYERFFTFFGPKTIIF